MKPLVIYINSSDRWDRVRSVKQMPEEWKAFTFIATTAKQAKKYKMLGWRVLSFPEAVPHFLSSERQWLLENSPARYVWMMDDDLAFQYRKDGKLLNCKPAQMEKLLEELTRTVQSGFPLVGVSARFGNNTVEEDHADITRVSRCYVVDTRVVKELKLNIAPFEPFLMQDFYMTLSFLKAGFKTRVLYNYAQGDGGSNTKGGCSRYRTPELLRKVSLFMARSFPGVVTVTEKTTKGGWNGFPVDAHGNVHRTDVVVQWKKAYRPKKDASKGVSAFL